MPGRATAPASRSIPGLEPGSEFLWGFLVAGPETFLGADFFKYAVYDGKDFDWHKMNLDSDVDAANQKLAADINNTNPDLSKFAARGGKLILYSGWGDALIQPGNAINYYDSVVKAQSDTVDKFARLYLAPGMGHCSGGPGPNAFGSTRYLNAGQPNPPVLDPDHDLISAVVAWVEHGQAPQRHRRHQVRGRRPGERDRHATSALPLSGGRGLYRQRRHQRRGEFLVR